MNLFGLYLHECHRHECKTRAKQTSDIVHYYVLGMCSSHGTLESTQYCKGGRKNPTQQPLLPGGTHYSKISLPMQFSMGLGMGVILIRIIMFIYI